MPPAVDRPRPLLTVGSVVAAVVATAVVVLTGVAAVALFALSADSEDGDESGGLALIGSVMAVATAAGAVTVGRAWFGGPGRRLRWSLAVVGAIVLTALLCVAVAAAKPG